MRKRRFAEAQIIAILKELDAGAAATELARRHGFMPTPSGNGVVSAPAWKPAL